YDSVNAKTVSQSEIAPLSEFLQHYKQARPFSEASLSWDQKAREGVSQHDPDRVLHLLNRAGSGPAAEYWKARALLEKSDLREATDVFLGLTKRYSTNPEYLY